MDMIHDKRYSVSPDRAQGNNTVDLDYPRGDLSSEAYSAVGL